MEYMLVVDFPGARLRRIARRRASELAGLEGLGEVVVGA